MPRWEQATISRSEAQGCGSGVRRIDGITSRKVEQPACCLKKSREVGSLGILILILSVAACAQPQLIENSALNQGRVYDTVRRASDASGLKVSHPLSVKLANRVELHEILRGSETVPAEQDLLRARLAGERIMGFPQGPENFLHTHAGLLSLSAAGLYIARTQTLYVVSEPARSEKGSIYLNALGDLGHELTLAHEVIHALQHIHYPEIFELETPVWERQTDAALALQAAVEGDASFWSGRSMGFWGRLRDPEDVLAAAQDIGYEPMSDLPPLVRERMVFPYIYGYRFAYHEGKDGLKSPPASTEQVLHIRSKGRAAFLAIDLSDFGRELESKGCRVLFQDTMGELTLSLWLRSFDSATDARAWNGWDGDRWIAAECDNAREAAWLTSWDTEQDAQEFERAISGVGTAWQHRGGVTSVVVPERQGREVLVTTAGVRSHGDQLKQLARRARVTTRAELAEHFSAATIAAAQPSNAH